MVLCTDRSFDLFQSLLRRIFTNPFIITYVKPHVHSPLITLLSFLYQRSRRGGGGGGSLFGSRKPAARAPPKPAARPSSSAPATRPSAQTPAPQQSGGGGMMSGLGSTIAQGMAFGTGSAMAHQAVGAIAGSFGGGGDAEVPTETATDGAAAQPGQQQQLQGACGQDKQMFYECLQVNRGDQEACRFLYDTLQSCQRNDNQMQFS